MSSIGQAVGMVVGGTVGFFAGGNVMLGASIGGAIGGYIDPPKGANTTGPRLEDRSVQTSTYGADIPQFFGTDAFYGNVIWLEGDQLKEHKNTKKVGGKGGSTSKQTSFSYTATFAVAFVRRPTAPIVGIRKLWLANQLVYDAGSSDLSSILVSNQQAGLVFAVYDGRDDQLPDPRWQADKGAANVSGHPGLFYMVFYDLDLTEKYTNTLMATQVKVEAISEGGVAYDHQAESLGGVWGGFGGRHICSAVADRNGISYCVLTHDPWTMNPNYAEFIRHDYGIHTSVVAAFALTGYINNPHRIMVCQADEPQAILLHGWITTLQLSWVTAGGVVYSPVMNMTTLPYRTYSASVAGTDTFLTCRQNAPVYKFSGGTLVGSSASSYRIKFFGLSDNYLFGVYDSGYPQSSTTVYKFNRSDLTLAATYTQSVTGSWAAISVIDDTTFFTLSENVAYKWVGGVVVGNYPGLLPYEGMDGQDAWFSVVDEDPLFASLAIDNTYLDTARHVHIGYQIISAGVAKLHDIVKAQCARAGIAETDLDLTELTNYDVDGFETQGSGTPREALEQLQAVYPFDVLPSGYKIKFKDRGSASVLTIQESDLGTHTGKESGVRFETSLEMPSQIPKKVAFRFKNAAREYDIEEQDSAFVAEDVVNTYAVSVPLVMSSTQGKRAADVLLRKEWAERAVVKPFALPPTDDYRKLEPADVVDVVAQGRTHSVRLTRVQQLTDGRVECEGRLTASSAYTSTAEAQAPLVLGPVGLPLKGPSELLLLDIPRITAEQDVPGLVLGMYGYTSGWPGGTAFRSDDYGESYNAITALDAKAEVFAVAGLPATVPPYSVDHVTALTITPSWTGADLSTLSDAAFYALGNLAAYGVDGRWEVVCFKTVVDNGDGTYTLKDFMRGRFGTEWAMSLHAAGDLLVMLDADRLEFAGMDLSAINTPRLWRGVTFGDSIDSVADLSDAYEAYNLKPLSPVNLKGNRSVFDYGWSLTWARRTRWPVRLFSGVAVPLAETSESYVVEVWNSGFTTLKRTFSGLTSASLDYSGAQQVSDFGANQVTLYLKIYQVSSVCGRGLPLVTSITLSVESEPYISGLVLGLHMEGANGSTTFVDVCGNTVTAAGNAQLTTGGTQFAFGASCGLFDGTGDYLTFAGSNILNFGANEFTIDGHIRLAATGTIQGIFETRGTSANSYSANCFVSYVDAAGKVNFYASSANAGTAGSWFLTLVSTTSLVAGSPYHVEISRDTGNVWRLFINGNMEATSTVNAAIGAPATTCYFGGMNSAIATLGYWLNGRAKDWRITKNFCRHSSSFTPPTTPFPDP